MGEVSGSTDDRQQLAAILLGAVTVLAIAAVTGAILWMRGGAAAPPPLPAPAAVASVTTPSPPPAPAPAPVEETRSEPVRSASESTLIRFAGRVTAVTGRSDVKVGAPCIVVVSAGEPPVELAVRDVWIKGLAGHPGRSVSTARNSWTRRWMTGLEPSSRRAVSASTSARGTMRTEGSAVSRPTTGIGSHESIASVRPASAPRTAA